MYRVQINIICNSSILFIPVGSSVWLLSGFAYGSSLMRCVDEFQVVRRVVIVGEMYRNSCLS